MFFIINLFLFSHLYYLIVCNCKNTIIQTVRAICIKLVRLICAINSYLIESTWLETLIVITLHVAMSTTFMSNTLKRCPEFKSIFGILKSLSTKAQYISGRLGYIN